jgi:hypothetical protein
MKNQMKNRNLIQYIFIIFLATTSTVFANAPQIRFAWLSDTHVGSSTGASDLRETVDRKSVV